MILLIKIHTIFLDRGASLAVVGKKRPAESPADEDSPIAAKVYIFFQLIKSLI